MIQTYSVDPYDIISMYNNFMQYHGKMRNNHIHASRVLPLSPHDPISKKKCMRLPKKDLCNALLSAANNNLHPSGLPHLQVSGLAGIKPWPTGCWNEHPHVANDGFVWLSCTQIHQKKLPGPGMFQEVQMGKCLWCTASYDQMPLFSRPEVGEGIRSATLLRFSEHWLTLNHVAALGLETMSWKVCHFHNSQSESQTHDGLQNFRQDSFGVQLLVSKW